jgi:diaminohydroxyphosphoribosylaminopyrimidine deaminase/5-amino-6-(5-phosphoribosylamino)uracil reductase
MQFSELDQIYMKRALELSKLGIGYVSPNPLVGCVLVKDDQVIGEGWHNQIGEAHAEVNAVASVPDPLLLADCTVYVTLEPCSHYGKTPPCTDLLIQQRVGRVVIAMEDPFSKVNGRGIARLRENGIQVEVGLLRREAMNINRRFITNMTKSRPYVILKWAKTADGFLARKNFDSRWISNEFSRQLVHKWRAEEDGILVGFSTAKYDDPGLDVRSWAGKDPLPIFIDPELSLRGTKLLGKDSICINNIKTAEQGKCHLQKVSDTHNTAEILHSLFNIGLGSIIVEGGAKTLRSFLDHDLWDEARIFTSSATFAEGIVAPTLNQDAHFQKMVDTDRLEYYYNKLNG